MNSGVAALLPTRTEGVHEAVVDHTHVLWNPADRRLRTLNPTAAAIWRLIPDTQTLGELTSIVADEFSAPAYRIRADVERVVEDFRSSGLLDGPSIRPQVPGTPRVAGFDARAVTVWVEALDAQIAIMVDDPALAGAVESDLAPISVRPPTDKHAGVSTIVVTIAEEGMVDLSVNGADSVRIGSPLGAVARVLGEVNALAVASVPHHLVLHAGAIGRLGRTVLLPADANSGKSTLTTALVAEGWRYLTDEAAAIDDRLMVRPYPKPIALDPGSFHLFPEFAPDTREDDLRAALRRRAWYLDPATIGSVGEPAPAHIVVSPRWSEGAATSVTALRPVEALHALLGHAFEFSRGGSHVFEILARLASDVSMYQLTYSDLGEATAAMDRLVG
jgi:hypothetical protein